MSSVTPENMGVYFLPLESSCHQELDSDEDNLLVNDHGHSDHNSNVDAKDPSEATLPAATDDSSNKSVVKAPPHYTPTISRTRVRADIVPYDGSLDTLDSESSFIGGMSKFIEEAEATKYIIESVHLGEDVFRAERFGSLFSFPNTLSLKWCGFRSGQTAFERQIEALTSDMLVELMKRGHFQRCVASIKQEESLVKFVLFLMSVHHDPAVLHQCYVFLVTALTHCSWHPHVAEFHQILVNYGASFSNLQSDSSDIETPHLGEVPHQECVHKQGQGDGQNVKGRDLQSDATQGHAVTTGVSGAAGTGSLEHSCKPSDLECKGDADVSNRKQGPGRNPEVGNKPAAENLCLVIRYLAELVRQKFQTFSADELSTLTVMVVTSALDPRFRSGAMMCDVECCVSVLLNAVHPRVWEEWWPRLVVRLANLTQHHHNKVYIVRLLPVVVARGFQVGRALALTMLRQLVHGQPRASRDTVTTDQQVRQVHATLRGWSLSEDSDFYEASSIVSLLDLAIGNERLRVADKSALQDLTGHMEWLRGQVRDNVHRADITWVKDMHYRLVCKWNAMKNNMGIKQGTLFSWLESATAPQGTEHPVS